MADNENVTTTIDNTVVEETPTVEINENERVTVAPPVPEALPTKLSDVDRLALQMAKMQRQIVLGEAKLALANNEKAETEYRYIVLQLYRKYRLGDADSISEESGEIIRA